MEVDIQTRIYDSVNSNSCDENVQMYMLAYTVLVSVYAEDLCDRYQIDMGQALIVLEPFISNNFVI